MSRSKRSPEPVQETGQAKAKKQRLDTLLVARGLAESRTRAQAILLAGKVYSNDRRLEKPGQMLAPDAALEVRGRDHPWVSRGGVKLAHGLSHFGIDPEGLVVLDLGASTGGFTDVVLSGGARKVYAVDVGHGQLAWKLRQDERVVVLEQTNARHLTSDRVPDPIDLIVCDASFIGLQTVLPAALSLAAANAQLVALVKPQFQVAKEEVGKGGVVRDPALRERACTEVSDWLRGQPGWSVLGLTESPITGPKGNVETLIGACFVRPKS